MVKHVDRVGRMADTLEFTNLALPRERFSADAARAARGARAVDDRGRRRALVIRHCYVERRMMPLNIYLDRATPDELEPAVRRVRQRDPRARDREHLPRRHALAELRRHALRAGRLLRLRRDRVPHRRELPAHPRRRRTRRQSSRRAVVRRRAQRRLPGGVRDVPARRPTPARAVPAPSRRPARARVLAGLPAPDRRPARSSTSSPTRSRFGSRARSPRRADVQSTYLRSAITALCPPKPKLLLIAMSTFASRATFGT